jgi:O-antigen/teichoic acid export membrane protein
MAIASPAHALRALGNVFNDALYRGSLVLLTNTIATSAIGFVFWTLAAHRYSAATVGTFSGVTSGVTLLATIAALGLPITMTRHIARTGDPRGLVFVAVTMITTAGTMLCLVTILFLGPHIPSALHIQQHGGMAFLVTILVVFTAVGGTLDAGLVATRSTRVLLIKNIVGSTVKLVAMLLLTTFRSSGLLVSYGLGLVLATALSSVALVRRLKGRQTGNRSFQASWHYLSITSGNYLATVIGILPLSIVPIEVLVVRGAAQTARFSIAFLIVGFLNFIPSTMGQVLFAEIARGGAPLGKQFRKALRGVYVLLLPCLALLLITAPFILRLFGSAYAAEATGCLRVLALSALPAGGTYLVDSLLVARDRTAAYAFMQIANAALVLGCVAVLLPRGLTAAAGGLAFAQVLTLILGLLVIATGSPGRHHSKTGTLPTGKTLEHPQSGQPSSRVVYHFEPQIRELLATWPMMPTTLIGECIGWDQPPQVLLNWVTELRSAHARVHVQADRGMSRIRYEPGEVAQCSLWFPPTEVPVGFGQTRSAKQLPVLTMITGYSRRLSAILIPSVGAEDLFAGWWKLMADLRAVPHMLTAHSESSIGWWANGKTHITPECSNFCRSLRTAVVVARAGDPTVTGLIEQAHIYLEHSFLRHRTFSSPGDFNSQLQSWLTLDNARSRRSTDRPPAELIATDRKAMLPLPAVPPVTGWRLSLQMGNHPFVRFDHNEYPVHPAVVGRTVQLVADLSHVRVFCDGEVVAEHDRVWTREQVIRNSAQRKRQTLAAPMTSSNERYPCNSRMREY